MPDPKPGHTPPETADGIPGPTPTGTFAGETEEARRGEQAAARALEDAVPDRPGSWKASGAVPNAAPDHTPKPTSS